MTDFNKQFKNNDGSLNADYVESLITSDVQAAINNNEKSLKEDWKNVETNPCESCKSTGRDPDNMLAKCIACDGSGHDYVLEYGVEGGKIFARAHQSGLQHYLQVAREYRELEASNPTAHHNTMGLKTFIMPSIARIELLARGVPVDEMIDAGDMRGLGKEMRKAFGDAFMTTNLVTL